MKARTKKALLVFHRWTGISAGLIIVLVGVTGSILVFEDELDVALNPDLYSAEIKGDRLPLDEIVSQTVQAHPGWQPAFVSRMDDAPGRTLTVTLRDADGNERQVFVDPFTAEIVGERSSLSSMALIRRLHGDLTLGAIGEDALGLLSILLMVMFTVGLALWWPRKARVPEALSVKWDGGSNRVIRDLHNTGGVYMFVFLFLSAVTVPPIVWKLTAPQVGPPAATAAPQARPPAATASPRPAPANAGPPMPAQAGGPPPSIPWQNAADAALEAVPDSWLGFILRPAGPQPFYLIRVFPAGENAVARQSTVFVNRYTGEIIRISAPAAPTWMSLLSADFAASLHSGAVAGLPGRLVMFVAGLFFPALFATGFLLWWRRRAPSVAARRAADP
ncbi:MAG: PepSY-associated TM helix domain-containing protein [Gammaproteobacteria bacterium]|nr:PepSY-associated TM helix domain-containing protein [Gammaproteobacteria bacterium]